MLGGSLAHVDPAAEYPTAVLALDVQFVIHGLTATRVVSAQDFFVGYLTTTLAPHEILTEVIPTTAAAVDVHGGVCRRARVAVAGVGPTPVRLSDAEHIFERGRVSADIVRAAGKRAAELVADGVASRLSSAYRLRAAPDRSPPH